MNKYTYYIIRRWVQHKFSLFKSKRKQNLKGKWLPLVDYLSVCLSVYPSSIYQSSIYLYLFIYHLSTYCLSLIYLLFYPSPITYVSIMYLYFHVSYFYLFTCFSVNRSIICLSVCLSGCLAVSPYHLYLPYNYLCIGKNVAKEFWDILFGAGKYFSLKLFCSLHSSNRYSLYTEQIKTVTCPKVFLTL